MDSRREAALHFSSYLCATKKISAQQPFIDRDELKRVFSDMYQPQYGIQCLEFKTLVPTLAKAGLLEKPSNNSNQNVNFKWNMIEDQVLQKGSVMTGKLPEKAPSRLTKPKQRLIISQRYTLDKENRERPDGLCSDRCEVCKVSLTSMSVEDHKRDELHILRMRFRKSRRDFDDAKHILAVNVIPKSSEEMSSLSASPLEVSCRVGMKYQFSVTCSNLLDNCAVFVKKVIALMPHKDVQLEEVWDKQLQPGVKLSLELKAQFSARGAVLYPIVFKLEVGETKQTKYHLAVVSLLIQSELMDQLGPSEPYHAPMGPIVKLHSAALLPGKPCEDGKEHDLQLTLEYGRMHFEIPPVLRNFLNNGFKEHPNMSQLEREKLKAVRDLLPKGDSRNSLSDKNYCQLLELLLFIEEHQMSRDIHYYDMHDVVLKKNHLGLWLKVPGLVDKRPSLLINDTVILNFVDNKYVSYEGYIQKIEGNMVRLGVHKTFYEKYTSQKVEVQFNISRGVLRSMHLALCMISLHGAQRLLFPRKEPKPVHLPPLKPWFNDAIKENPEQQSAVRNIVRNSSEFAPYLVFGPPGTGKTVTLVETIMQIWDPVGKSTRILVCAPSNSAADEITTRLLEVVERKKVISSKVKAHIFRMCAFSRTLDMMPLIIAKSGITNHDSSDGFVRNPRLDVIMSYDIVISTFSNCTRLIRAELPPGHFTHIIMDEVGQALEPEALIPLAGLATYPRSERLCCQVVMAGDPKQLGPILQSPIAAKFGLDKSMLERLMSMPLYSKRPETNSYNPDVLTKLILNYRSHPSILKVSNNLFYDDELQSAGDRSVIESACNWRGLKKKNFPLIFHGVEGKDEREGTSPSFFNRQEVEVVTDYIQKLLGDKVTDSKGIGVVTPYNKQVKKIQKACELLKLKNIDVASVEQFQGQERQVIIISTVRSNPQFLSFDYMFQLGFLQNPKRFNVAVTRARSLLILVGNPNVLQHDPCWKAMMKHCIDNDSYTGIPFQFDAVKKEEA